MEFPVKNERSSRKMASEAHEITHIRDEDVLRTMWHRTEDFGRKKEIRAHMYRLREERLRNLYVADVDGGGGDVNASALLIAAEQQTKVTKQHQQQHDRHESFAEQVMMVTGKTSALLAPSQENLLADQSYQSFKTKEVRDSESPTR